MIPSSLMEMKNYTAAVAPRREIAGAARSATLLQSAAEFR
jgi:hypothetical protein